MFTISTVRSVLAIVTFIALASCAARTASRSRARDTGAAHDFNVLSWNIWHGGREDGETIGPQRTANIIKQSDAALIALQETYGSGQILADTLGYTLVARGTNVSILTSYPVIEDISVSTPFHCVGALVSTPHGPVAFYSIWLPYAHEIWEEGTRDVKNRQHMLDACLPSLTKATEILNGIDAKLAATPDVPVIIAGDFNSMSCLDYVHHAKDQYNIIIDWPTSRAMLDRGYTDTYRTVNPVVDRANDRTWSPRFPKQDQDRIDYVYTRGSQLMLRDSRVIDTFDPQFPSDHAALCTGVSLLTRPGTAKDTNITAATYNIKHGEGMDGKVNILRTATVIKRFNADIVALQEMDMNVKRSGNQNHVTILSRELNMHAAFGSFMEYGGGEYGMAILSRFPILSSRELTLPIGNEPRIALIADATTTDGQRFHIVNVHFDWVDDDTYRFAQAKMLHAELNKLPNPYILLGDFNDQPGSRTLDLFNSNHLQCTKAQSNRFTFPSRNADSEIDFIFTFPPSRWRPAHARVIQEPDASDHSPVVSSLQLITAPEALKSPKTP